MEKEPERVEGEYRRLYDEDVVRNIMLATSYCIKDMLQENPAMSDEEIYDFMEDNYMDIIEDTLDEYEDQFAGDEGEEKQ